MINIRRAKTRGIVFGAVGGLLGWFLAETLWGPATTFGGAFVVGGLSGLGIGLCLGAADGILSGSKTLILRGLIAGLGFGLFGGGSGRVRRTSRVSACFKYHTGRHHQRVHCDHVQH